MLAGPAVVAALLALAPLGYIGVRAMEHGPSGALGEILTARTWELLVRSLGLVVAVTFSALVIGISLAWLVVKTRLPGAPVWAVVATLPLAVPSYVSAFAWISAVPWMTGLIGSVVTLTLVTYPYVFLPVAAVLRRLDPAQEEVARTLGHGPVRTFFAVTLRRLRPAAAGGSLLVALYVLSDFGAVSLMRYDAFTRAIYLSYRGSFDRTPAAALSCVLVVITILIVMAESRSRGRASYARLGGGAARTAPRTALGWARTPALAWCGLIAAAGVLFPLGTVTYWLFTGASAGADLQRLTETTGATLAAASAGAALTTVLALPIGIIAARHRGRLPRLLETAGYAGHALPGIVVALALVFFAVRYAYPIYQEFPLLVVAYAILFMPIAIAAVRASVLQAPPVLDDVARSLGRTPLRVLRDVTVPIAGPGIAAGAALVFVTIMKELPATLLLRPTGMETLATRLWTQTENAAYGAAAPYAAMLILIAALPSYLLGRSRS